MTPTFILSAQAEQDIDALAEYLARESLDFALRFYDAAWSTFDGLAAMPHKGRPRAFSGLDLAGARSWRIDGFPSILAFYTPTDSGVPILRVMLGARDLDTELDGHPPTP